MHKKNERENEDIPHNNEQLEQNIDIIYKLLNNKQEFIGLTNKLLDSEFQELFPKILNLPKIDFLNQLTSNVSYIISEQFSPKIFENDKFISLLASACHSFDKIYNKCVEELSEGWEKYNFIKINQNAQNEKLESFFLTKFRKHCNKTQNFAIHNCKKNGEFGNFIIVYGTSSSKHKNSENKKKIKFLICDNCRKSYFINEFHNYCDFCKISYLCSPLFKDENENLLPAALNPAHCEMFVNEELLCIKCKNILYIDLINNNLICKNQECDFCVPIDECKNINFKCKYCKNYFYSNVKIFNPLDLEAFKDNIKKALLYKRKAYPGKLSCCQKIKEKKTDFFHNKDCKGNLYFGEFNKKLILVCSKCKAVNLYSKFIWTCPECGVHFRDKKSEESEIKVKKTKSSNKLIKARKLFPNFEDVNNSKLNSRKKPFAEILNKKNHIYEKSNFCSSYAKYKGAISERKRNQKYNFSNEKILKGLDHSADRNSRDIGISKKIKRRYIFGKILSWGTPGKNSSDNEENNKNNKNDNNNNNINNDNNIIKITEEDSPEVKNEYYDKKVMELINPIRIIKENPKIIKEVENDLYLCKSDRVYFRNNKRNIDSYCCKDKEINNPKIKRFYGRNKLGAEYLSGNYESMNISNSKFDINDYNCQTTLGNNYVFNKKNSPIKNFKIDNDLKCKKFIPIKLKYSCNKISEILKQENNKNNNNYNSINNINNNNNYNINKNNNNNEKIDNKFCINNYNRRGIVNIFESHRIKKIKPLDLKKNILNQPKKEENINIINNNKESWQSKETKETTTKGSIESKNSIFSQSPPKEEEFKKVNKNSLCLNSQKFLIKRNEEIDKKNNLEEDGIIPFENIDPKQDIIIENKGLKEDINLYKNIQRRLKNIILKGKLPKFDLDKFTVDKQIGDGSFGVIYLVHNIKSKRKYAMKKIIANTINSLEIFQKEFEIVHNNPHPSILDIKGVYIKCFDSTTFVLYVLMDLAEKDWEVEINDRQKYKKFYREKELISILKQLSSALFYLQKEKNVAHRDIKPENVLIFREKNYGEFLYKLCDFGEAKDYAMIHSKKNKTLRGTELYMSPALYNGLQRDAAYVNHDAYKSDVFSLGCCMIIAATLDFDIINEIRELQEQIKITDFLYGKILGKYSQKLIDIFLKMINFNEKERIDFIQLKEIIESTF